MSETNSTARTKPAKPSPDFPLFPHATGRWAKKIKGKMHYFGHWADPQGAQQEYQDFLVGKPRPSKGAGVDGCSPGVETATANKGGKPAKPCPEFPLFAHSAGVWAKKIRGKLHYFGPWADPDGALKNYDAQKEALHAGRKPRADAEAVTVKYVVNHFLDAKETLRDAGELSPRTWKDYKQVCDLVVANLGKSRLAEDVDPEDFAALRKKVAKRWGAHRLGSKLIQYTRSIFKHAFDAGLISRPARFGPGFKRPTKKVLRLHRAEQGPKLFTAEEIRRLLAEAGVQLKVMILLGINAGFGNSDCAQLPQEVVNLKAAVIDYPRPKTGIPRRCPLWPETVAALRDVLAKRPEPKAEEDAGLVFITKYGGSWDKETSTNPISQEMGKLLRALHIDGRKGLGFYTLRHTFRTVADELKDQPAADYIMGHEVPHMSTVYRETISDGRLRAVTDHVRAWLFGGPATSKPEHASASASAQANQVPPHTTSSSALPSPSAGSPVDSTGSPG
jgi:integrase